MLETPSEADQIEEMENREGETERETMRWTPYEINEWANSLHEQNRFNVDGDVVKCFNWNPIHEAAFKGQKELLIKLLEHCLLLSETVDSHQRSPLHLASANGHVEIVEILAAVSPKMCLACDHDGLNPVHAAAISGNEKVYDVLFKANPHAARARVGRGVSQDTILHLCVKYDQREFLDMLFSRYHLIGEDLVNAKDDDGNNILHLAVADKNVEMILTLLNHTPIDLSATNARDQTALDIILLGRRKGTEPDDYDILIEDNLRFFNCPRRKELIDTGWFAEKRSTLMIVAILMVTIAFQAGVNPPGGFWQDNSDGHKAGEAVMAYNHPKLYASFIASNAIIVVCSLTTISLLSSRLQFKNWIDVGMLVMLMSFSSLCMAFTFICATVVFTPKWKSSIISHAITAVVATWCSVQAIFLLIQGSRLIALTRYERRRKAESKFRKRVSWASRVGVNAGDWNSLLS